MNKVIIALTAALVLQSSAMASNFDYEATALVGVVFPETDFTVENQLMNGFEMQFNNLAVVGIKPELSVLYSYPTDYRRVEGASTSVTRLGLNGVYDIEANGFTPFVKAGAGYEFLYKHYDGYIDGAFLDAGAGIKVALDSAWDFKVEALYLVKYRDEPNYESNYDNNGIVMAGLTYKFGAEPTPPKEEPKVEAPKPVPAPAPVPAPLDSDKDGVIDPNDKCPNTPTWATVDNDGCPIKRTMRINFPFDSAVISQDEKAEVSEFATFLKKEQYNLHLIGHTDNIGSKAYNQKLSEKRAASVKEALSAEGIDASRMNTSGQGEMAPLKPNDSKANRAFNRRVEVELITPSK